MKIKSYWFILPLVGVVAFFFLRPSPWDVSERLNTLSNEERDSLEWLFRDLNSAGGYFVLFGTKPICIASFLEIDPASLSKYQLNDLLDLSSRLCLPNLKTKKGWATWKKYEHLFPSKKFVLRENKGTSHTTIVIINKNELLSTIEKNIDIFREVLGNSVTPKTILHDCSNTNDIIFDTLKNRDDLLGILLGFGRHNSELFFRINKTNRHINELDTIDGKQLDRNPTLTLTHFNDAGILDFNPLLMSLPGFMVDANHPETQHLKNEYMNQYKTILKKYEKGDFLQITLTQFCN